MGKKMKQRGPVDFEGMPLEDVDELIQKAGIDVGFATSVERVDRISTGLIGIDTITGGGFPRGRMTELYGAEGSGKTALLQLGLASALRNGGEALLLDEEGTFDPDWAEVNGTDISRLRVGYTHSGEEAYDVILAYVRSGKLDIIGVDSIASLVPAAEIEGAMADQNIGLAARLNSKAMRLLSNELKRNERTALVFVNQIRQNVQPGSYNPTTTSGGKAIAFYMTLRLNMRRIGWVKEGEDITGGEYQAEITKAKLTGARPKAKAIFRIDFEHGVDFAYEAFEQAVQLDLVTKSGSWFNTREGERYHGEAALLENIRHNMQVWQNRIAAAGGENSTIHTQPTTRGPQ